MRAHLTLKQIAAALGVRETYAGQAFDPAIRKVAALFMRFPVETMRMLSDEAERQRTEACREMRDRAKEFTGLP